MRFVCVLMLLTIGLYAEEKLNFSYQVRPILSKYCFACHGPDKAKGKLRLDIHEGIKKATKSGKAEESELIQRILTDDEDDVMPPHETGKKLKDSELVILKQWINEGADFGEHWSFQPIKKPEIPKVKSTKKGLTDLDKIVIANLENKGLSPAPEAEKRKLIRRLSLDIRGVLPSIDEVDKFLADNSPGAYENLVDELLKSELYGEKWAAKWLDLARYADTKGYEKDRHREIWRYRDWVIKAINDDMPYDEFTEKQLAGDLLPKPDYLATAFHRNTMTNDEGGTDNEEFRTEAVKDRVDTTGMVWLGLSLACAKCHTHKYDPVSIEEYYQIYSFFNQTEDNDLYNDAPLMRMPTDHQKAILAAVRKDLKEKNQSLNKTFNSAEIQKEFASWKEEQLSRWISGKLLSTSTQSGIKINREKDRFFVESASAGNDVYAVTYELPAGSYKTMELKVLPDKRLPNGGSGLNKDGNFALSYIELKIIRNGQQMTVENQDLKADYEEGRMNAAFTLKPHDSPNKAWSVNGKQKEKHFLILKFKSPIEVIEGDQVLVNLVHRNKFHDKKLGSFDLAFSKVEDNPNAYIRDVKKTHRQLFIEHHKDLKKIDKEIADLKNKEKQNLGSQTPIMRDRKKDLRPNFVHDSGFFLNKGKEVAPGTPEFLHQMQKDFPKNRLGFSKWLMDRNNPLTARVAVNRVWAQIFGLGIVETEEDFGNQGTMPSNPDLIDWLALEFINNGWSQKKLIKTIVTSATYKQSSAVSAELAEKDKFNVWLARGPRFRMTAEMIRDSSLKVSGLLSKKMYGPSVMPYQPPGLWKSTYNTKKWETSKGQDKYRRGLYTYLKRTSPYPTMTAFDAPSREICTARRIRSNTPLQALVTLNDPVYVEVAQAFARKLIEAASKDEERIQLAYQSALSRNADSSEVTAIQNLLRERLKVYKSDPDAAAKMAEIPLGKVPAKMNVSEAAAWTTVCNVILNLDEFLTKE